MQSHAADRTGGMVQRAAVRLAGATAAGEAASAPAETRATSSAAEPVVLEVATAALKSSAVTAHGFAVGAERAGKSVSVPFAAAAARWPVSGSPHSGVASRIFAATRLSVAARGPGRTQPRLSTLGIQLVKYRLVPSPAGASASPQIEAA